MSFSPLSSFCNEVAFISDCAFALSLPELHDPSATRDDVYFEACIALNALRDQGALDDGFFDYLCMHLDYAFRNGGGV